MTHKTVLVLFSGLFLVSALAGAEPNPARYGGADASYLEEVHQRIHPRWTNFLLQLQTTPPGTRFRDDASLAEDVVISIDWDGAVSSVERGSGSGLAGFDDAPVELLHDLGRLNPPPSSLQSDDGKVYVRWHFGRGKTACEQHEVVERRLPFERAMPLLIAADRTADAVSRLAELYAEDPEQGAAMMGATVEAVVRAEALSVDASRRTAAVAALGHLPNVDAILVKMTRDAEVGVRRAALSALGDRPPTREGTAAVASALAGNDCGLAAAKLRKLGDRRALPPLRAALADGHSPVEVTEALIALGDSAETAALVRGMLAPASKQLVAGVKAARLLADPSLGVPLVALFDTASDGMRAEILDALAAAGRQTAMAVAHPALQLALKSTSPVLRAHGFAAAGRLGDTSIATRYRMIDALAEPTGEVRAAAAVALVEAFGEVARDELIPPLRDRDPKVRLAFGRALVAHPFNGSAAMVNRLVQDSDASVRLAMFEALATDGNPKSRSLFARASLDPSPDIQMLAMPPSKHVVDPQSLADNFLHAESLPERMRAASAWLSAASAAAPPTASAIVEASNTSH